MEEYREKIEKMERELEEAADLQKQIKKINAVLEQCESEKADLENLLEETEKKCKNFEAQLEKAAKDKEAEVRSLQKGKYVYSLKFVDYHSKANFTIQIKFYFLFQKSKSLYKSKQRLKSLAKKRMKSKLKQL